MENDAVGNLRAKVAAWRQGNPSRSLKVIAVAGAHGKTTTTLLIGEILQEAGKSVMTMTNQGSFHNGVAVSINYDHSAENIQRVLATAKKKNVDYVIMEISKNLIEARVLPTLMIEMSVITNDSPLAQELLRHPVEYTVVPSGFNVSGHDVAPHQAISFGHDESAEAQIVRVRELRKGTEVDLVVDHQTKIQVATYLVGQANALNVAAAVSAAYVLAANTSTFQEGVARLERVPSNYEYLSVDDIPYDIVVDAATSELSVGLVLASAAGLKRRRLLVATDSSVSSDLYPEIKRLSDRAVAIGASADFPGIERADTLQAAFDLLKRAAKKDDTILLLGNQFAGLDENGRTVAHGIVEAKSE